MHLLAAQEASRGHIRHHVTVDAWREGLRDVIAREAPWRGRVQRFGRHRAQRSDRSVAVLTDEGEAAGTGFVKPLQRPVPAVPERSALADRLVEQPARER